MGPGAERERTSLPSTASTPARSAGRRGGGRRRREEARRPSISSPGHLAHELVARFDQLVRAGEGEGVGPDGSSEEVGCLARHDEAGESLVGGQQDERHPKIEITFLGAVQQVAVERRCMSRGQRLKRWRKSSSELPTPGFASRTRQRYSPTPSTSPRRTRSRSQGEKSTQGTQLDGLCVRERQGKSGWPSPPAKPGRSAATRSARVMAVEPKSRVCIVKRRPRFRFDSGHGSSRAGRAIPRRPRRAGDQNILTRPAVLARANPQPISRGLYNEPATVAGS